jgi:CCR4-NOT transcription complex subunit 2
MILLPFSGLHNIHGNFNLPNMPGSLAQRNAAMSGLPSSGVQQTGGSISGRFASNNLPGAMSQVRMPTSMDYGDAILIFL